MTVQNGESRNAQSNVICSRKKKCTPDKIVGGKNPEVRLYVLFFFLYIDFVVSKIYSTYNIPYILYSLNNFQSKGQVFSHLIHMKLYGRDRNHNRRKSS